MLLPLSTKENRVCHKLLEKLLGVTLEVAALIKNKFIYQHYYSYLQKTGMSQLKKKLPEQHSRLLLWSKNKFNYQHLHYNCYPQKETKYVTTCQKNYWEVGAMLKVATLVKKQV